MKEANILFTECEHDGDLETYLEDLRQSGAKILNSSVNEEEETGTVRVQIEDIKSFIEKFRQTDSYEFSSIGR